MALADSGAFVSLNHIPPLPIPHRLEYPLGSRMHLGVVNPRLQAMGRPFPRSPWSRSRVNLRVLRPLTRGPQDQPSAQRTPHDRPGVQGYFRTSRGQPPDSWPMIHDSMATVFPFPRGCCLALMASHPIPFSVPLRHIPSAAQSPRRVVSQSHGAVVWPVPHPCPSPVTPSHPIPCLYPTGPPATPWRGPTGSSSIRGPFRARCTGRSSPMILAAVFSRNSKSQQKGFFS